MSAEDPISILDDDTDDANDAPKQQPMVEGEDDDPEEYVVEAIRARKRDPRTGNDVFLVKWEDYPESDNTWEPAENLKCPEIVQKFLEQEANKRKRRKVESNHPATESTPSTSKSQANPSATKRPRRADGAKSRIFVEDVSTEEDDDNDSLTGVLASQKQVPKEPTPEPKGFQRGLELEQLLTATVGDDDKIYFFVKWHGYNDLEMLEVDEIEKYAPQELCRWYRSKFFCNIKYDKPPE